MPSGMGGSTTAAILARTKDKRVLVLERHFRKDLKNLVSAEHPGRSMITLSLGLDRDHSCMDFHGENYWILDGLDHDVIGLSFIIAAATKANMQAAARQS